jgi:hypothetical protein
MEKCPKCGCEELENGESFFDDGEFSVEVICTKCENKWFEVYTFSHCEDTSGDKID